MLYSRYCHALANCFPRKLLPRGSKTPLFTLSLHAAFLPLSVSGASGFFQSAVSSSATPESFLPLSGRGFISPRVSSREVDARGVLDEASPRALVTAPRGDSRRERNERTNDAERELIHCAHIPVVISGRSARRRRRRRRVVTIPPLLLPSASLLPSFGSPQGYLRPAGDWNRSSGSSLTFTFPFSQKSSPPKGSSGSRSSFRSVA